MVEITDYDGDGVKFEDARGNSIAAERAKIVQRDASGAVEFEQAGTDQATGITNTGSRTLNVSANRRVNYDVLKFNANTGSGNASIKRDGNVVTI